MIDVELRAALSDKPRVILHLNDGDAFQSSLDVALTIDEAERLADEIMCAVLSAREMRGRQAGKPDRRRSRGRRPGERSVIR